jgi:hypothetical protein
MIVPADEGDKHDVPHRRGATMEISREKLIDLLNEDLAREY